MKDKRFFKMDQQQLLCLSDSNHQGFLSAALQSKNLEHFHNALTLGSANPDLVDKNNFISIFEKCLQTPGHSEFIIECIKWGCDVNKVNQHFNKKPINFVVESEDPENINALFYNPTQQVDIDNLYGDLTPLHLLATNINENNYANIFNCLKELINRQANVNIPNRRSVTPILTIAKKGLITEQKENIIKYFLENANVDLDTYRDSEARTKLTNLFPNMTLPDKTTDEIIWDFLKLYTTLDECDELEFLTGLDILLKKTENEDNRNNIYRESYSNETLLMLAARRGKLRAAEKLLRSGADVNNYKFENMSGLKSVPNGDCFNTKSPIELACINGNWEVLLLFLKCPNIEVNDSPLLVNVVKNIGEHGIARTCDYKKCFNILLNFEKININQKDIYGNTALHIAVKYNNQSAALALLQKGAYIGSQNKFSDFSITDINPKVLEKHFNHCITTNGRRSGDDKYEIIFEYSNLVPANIRKVKKQCSDEMAPIEYMAKSNELKHLIKHPLIASFLFLKWYRLARIFYINFACYTVYCLAMILYLLFCYGQETSEGVTKLLYAILTIGAIYVFTRELVQFIMSPKIYLKNTENYLEIALIAMTILVLSIREFDESTRRTVAAFTILLVVTEFFLLTGSLPVLSFSTHLVMLKTVSKSFMRSLLLYSIILIAFALCFYTLLGEDKTSKPSDPTGEEDDEFNNFVNPGVSIIKTVVMLTGEFDASSINFKHNMASYVIFLMFLFLISTVLFNLLNGLAVSDTQAIKTEAELMNFIHRAHLMARYEKILLGNGESECCNFMLRRWSSSLMSVFPDFLPLNILKVLPNANNQVKIPCMPQKDVKIDIEKVADVNSYYYDLDRAIKTQICCIGGQCSRMESKIVKYARNVLENKDRELEIENEKQVIENRMKKIEKCIDKILLKIEQVAEKVSNIENEF